MTCSRLAAAAALTIPALLVTATVGHAQRDETYRVRTTCKTKHTETRDFAKLKTEVNKVDRPGDGKGGKGGKRGTAAAVVPVVGAKVITKLIDISGPDNVVGKAKKSKLTNDNGIAKTKHEFNALGNYRVTIKVKVDGDVVSEDARDFGVGDRENGPCEPLIPGAG
jgi:hypothetical protein